MNVILIVSDTLRRDHVGCYGSRAETPNLNRFAAESIVFDRAYPASFPTGPHRQDLHSGRFTFPYQRWEGPAPGDPRLAEQLARASFRTLMVADTPALRVADYTRGFRRHVTFGHWEGPRATGRPWQTLELPAAPEKLRRPDGVRWYMAFDAMRQSEQDFYVGRTMSTAARWLEEERSNEPFFLYVDTFDPHEPWFPPPWYLDRYDPGYTGERIIEPAYEPAGYCTEREVQHMRARYAAMVTMVDAWIGHLFWTVDRLGLRENTAVIVTSDHGFYLADHGLVGKVLLNREDRIVGRYPLYGDITRVPLIARIPGAEPGRRNAFVQAPDIMPTILDLVGVPIPEGVQGASVLPIVRGEREKNRDCAVASLTFVQDAECRSPSTLITDEWSYVFGGDEAPHELFDLRSDPDEATNRIADEPTVAKELHERYLGFLGENGCPKERIDGRRLLAARPETKAVAQKFI